MWSNDWRRWRTAAVPGILTGSVYEPQITVIYSHQAFTQLLTYFVTGNQLVTSFDRIAASSPILRFMLFSIVLIKISFLISVVVLIIPSCQVVHRTNGRSKLPANWSKLCCHSARKTNRTKVMMEWNARTGLLSYAAADTDAGSLGGSEACGLLQTSKLEYLTMTCPPKCIPVAQSSLPKCSKRFFFISIRL